MGAGREWHFPTHHTKSFPACPSSASPGPSPSTPSLPSLPLVVTEILTGFLPLTSLPQSLLSVFSWAPLEPFSFGGICQFAALEKVPLGLGPGMWLTVGQLEDGVSDMKRQGQSELAAEGPNVRGRSHPPARALTGCRPALWHSRLSRCLRCWHPLRVLV